VKHADAWLLKLRRNRVLDTAPDNADRNACLQESLMKVAKWGNALAIRLPINVVRELGLKEGDQVDSDRPTPNSAAMKMMTRRLPIGLSR
jgi:hypothetical protein